MITQLKGHQNKWGQSSIKGNQESETWLQNNGENGDLSNKKAITDEEGIDGRQHE